MLVLARPGRNRRGRWLAESQAPRVPSALPVSTSAATRPELRCPIGKRHLQKDVDTCLHTFSSQTHVPLGTHLGTQSTLSAPPRHRKLCVHACACVRVCACVCAHAGTNCSPFDDEVGTSPGGSGLEAGSGAADPAPQGAWSHEDSFPYRDAGVCFWGDPHRRGGGHGLSWFCRMRAAGTAEVHPGGRCGRWGPPILC